MSLYDRVLCEASRRAKPKTENDEALEQVVYGLYDISDALDRTLLKSKPVDILMAEYSDGTEDEEFRQYFTVRYPSLMIWMLPVQLDSPLPRDFERWLARGKRKKRALEKALHIQRRGDRKAFEDKINKMAERMSEIQSSETYYWNDDTRSFELSLGQSENIYYSVEAALGAQRVDLVMKGGRPFVRFELPFKVVDVLQAGDRNYPG